MSDTSIRVDRKLCVGERMFYVPPNCGFVVLCRVTELGMGEHSYWIDEPVGHEVDFNELFDSPEEAVEHGMDPTFLWDTLDEWRSHKARFIVSTFPEGVETTESFLSMFPNKTLSEGYYGE